MLNRQAHQLLTIDSQLNDANNQVLQKETENQTLTMELMNLKESYQTLDSDIIHAKQEQDEAQFAATTTNDTEA
ncbi:unnamed protein product [Calypogeia fissa]